MLNHVLIPLDGSPLAEKAIAPATQILKAGGKITLVSIIETPVHWEFGVAPLVILEQSEKAIDQLKRRATAYLETVAAKLRADNFQVEIEILYGDPATAIVETAAARKVDAISISTHGRSGFSRWLFGSVTGKVLSAAPCAVFVIPAGGNSPASNITPAIPHYRNN